MRGLWHHATLNLALLAILLDGDDRPSDVRLTEVLVHIIVRDVRLNWGRSNMLVGIEVLLVASDVSLDTAVLVDFEVLPLVQGGTASILAKPGASLVVRVEVAEVMAMKTGSWNNLSRHIVVTAMVSKML